MSEPDMSFLHKFHVRQCLASGASFYRKITRMLACTAWILLKLVYTPHDTDCPIRRQFARFMLTTDDMDLHITVRKVKQSFRQSIEHASETGHLHKRLYMGLSGLRNRSNADNRDAERLVKYMKTFKKRAPHSSWELDNARLSIKYALSDAINHTCTGRAKWSAIAPVCYSLQETCLNSWSDMDVITDRTDRFVQGSKPTYVPSRSELVSLHMKNNPSLRKGPDHIWAAAYNMLLNKHIGPATGEAACIAIGFRQDQTIKTTDFKFYLVCDKWRCVHELVEVKKHGNELVLERSSEPLEYMTSTDTLAYYYGKVTKDSSCILFGVRTRDLRAVDDQVKATIVKYDTWFQLHAVSKTLKRKLERTCAKGERKPPAKAAASASGIDDDTEDADEPTHGGETQGDHLFNEGLNMLFDECPNGAGHQRPTRVT